MSTDTTLNILDIVRGTTVDGPGFRTSVYIAGCRHACPGCHNPQSWPFDAGTPMTIAQIMEVICEEDFDVTLTGGDPLYHPDEVGLLIDQINKTGHRVWLYTGFTLEEILSSERLRDVVKKTEAIVEGRYVEALRNTDLQFRGSENQRIVYVSDVPELQNT